MPKISKRLSDKKVENAPIEKHNYKLCDGEGLYLLIRKSGSKVWQYPYKYNNKRNTFTIGSYLKKDQPGHISLQDARLKRHEVRELLDRGINPHVYKDAQCTAGNKETTFEALGREWHSKGAWVPKHKKNILRSLESDVFPLIGEKQITEVTRKDIVTILEAIEQRNALDVAKRICQRCTAIFDYAIDKALCEDNPALGRDKFIKRPKTKHRPHLKEKDLPKFLYNVPNYHGRDYVRIAMQLLVLTFMRPGELRHARWDDVNTEKAILKIPAERMKMERDHIVPLSYQAMSLLKDLHSITGNSDLLFPSVKNNQKPISDVTLTKVLIIMGYTEDQKVVPHGFRHTASTILNEHGFNSDHIERQLAHVDKNKVRGVYNHAEYQEDRRKMMQWYADHLDSLRFSYKPN